MESFGAYFERWVATSARMLEVGADSGALAAQLRERGHVAAGFDPEMTGGLDQREAGACGDEEGSPRHSRPVAALFALVSPRRFRVNVREGDDG